jgi:hypothetical protein
VAKMKRRPYVFFFLFFSMYTEKACIPHFVPD